MNHLTRQRSALSAGPEQKRSFDCDPIFMATGIEGMSGSIRGRYSNDLDRVRIFPFAPFDGF